MTLHLLIDGYDGDAEKLADQQALFDLLNQAPEAMGMKAISPPLTASYREGDPLDWGLSGFVLIAESHLSFHTFPARGLVWADLFSCKGFDVESLLKMVKSAFGLGVIRFLVVARGLDEPERGNHSRPLPITWTNQKPSAGREHLSRRS